MGYPNPLLKLPAGRALLALPAEDRRRIELVMRALRAQANAEAENAWHRRKGPMAAYWRAVVDVCAAPGARAVDHRAGVMTQGRFIFPDEADAIAYWASRESKKWAVDITAGPTRRPTYRRTEYVGARTAEAAVESARRQILTRPPRGANFRARLAGPRELGCVPTPANDDSENINADTPRVRHQGEHE